MARTTKADYAKHYAEYQGKPEQIAKRSARNKARRAMVKKLGAAAVAGKDVDHKKPLRKGGGNGMSNLRLRSVKSNRGDTH
jgi:hypothetical protein